MTNLWTKTIVFSEEMKELVRKPFGELREGDIKYDEKIAKAYPIVVVGDYSFKKMLEAGMRPHVVVVDSKVERKISVRPDLTGYRVTFATNPPGTIQPEAARAVVEAVLAGGRAVLVDGEEDLLALPAMHALPPGGVLIYGQPRMGYVIVEESSVVRKRVEEVIRMATV